MAEERRICWPDFDATCLEGGCIHCNAHPFRSVAVIENKVLKMTETRNRGDGELRVPLEAFQYGKRSRWNNAEMRG